MMNDLDTRLDLLKRALAKTKSNSGHAVITFHSKWYDRFEILVKEGIFVIPPEKYLDVAKVWGVKGDERRARQIVNEYLRKMYARGVLDVVAPATYAITSTVLSYLQGGDNLDEVVKEIQTKTEEMRRRRGGEKNEA